eukprot:superscaffoldBa00001070_g8806
MDKELRLTLLLLLLLCHKGNTESQYSCPYRCQCFTPVQVLCADERMTSLPSNMSKQVKDFIIMTSAVAYLFPHTLEESPQLNKLIFLNNALRSIHAQAFEPLTELQELEISGNPWLEHLFVGTFSKQGNLTKLLLNYNRFETVLHGMFDSLKNLQTLQMKGNILSNLPTFLFLNLHNLRILDLSQNKLEEVKRETFSGLVRLEILKINNNLIRNISSNTFDNISQLIELNLEGNKISELADNIFSVLTKLRVLNLRGNRLTTFSDKVFGFEASNLKELNLKGNRLTQLTVRLHGNPWKCDCHLWYLHDWVLKNSQDVEMLDRMLCESPGFLRKRTVISIDKDQLVCQVSKDEMSDLSSCSLQVSSDTMTIKCKVDKCSPLTVKVQFQEDDGSVEEHILKSELAEHFQCNNETTIESPIE